MGLFIGAYKIEKIQINSAEDGAPLTLDDKYELVDEEGLIIRTLKIRCNPQKIFKQKYM